MATATAAVAIACSPMALVRLFPDDAFFYMKTAANLAGGAGSSFDGINSTNGYHPLYMFLLAAVSSVVPLRGSAGLYAVMALDTVLTVAWLYAADACARALDMSKQLRLVLIAGLVPLAFTADYGTEVNVVLSLAWLFVAAALDVARSGRAGPRIGVVGALIVFARLDAVLFVALVGGACLLAMWLADRWTWKSVLAVWGPAALLVAAMALYNSAAFGHASTVSSWLKFGLEGWRDLPARISGTNKMIVAGLTISVALGVLALKNAWSGGGRRLVLGGVGAWVIAQFVTMFSMVRGGPEWWYFPMPLAFGAFLGLQPLHAWFVARPYVLRAALVATAVAASAGFSVVATRAHLGRDWYFDDGVKMGQWIDEHMPPDVRIYQVDNAGVVAYFANRSVINGDGLINGWEYQERLRSGELAQYLEEHSVHHIVFDELHDEDELRIPVPLWSCPPLELRFLQPPDRVARFGRFVLLHPAASTLVVSPPSVCSGLPRVGASPDTANQR